MFGHTVIHLYNNERKQKARPLREREKKRDELIVAHGPADRSVRQKPFLIGAARNECFGKWAPQPGHNGGSPSSGR